MSRGAAAEGSQPPGTHGAQRATALTLRRKTSEGSGKSGGVREDNSTRREGRGAPGTRTGSVLRRAEPSLRRWEPLPNSGSIRRVEVRPRGSGGSGCQSDAPGGAACNSRDRGTAAGGGGRDSGEEKGRLPGRPRPLRCHWAAAAGSAPPFLHPTRLVPGLVGPTVDVISKFAALGAPRVSAAAAREAGGSACEQRPRRGQVPRSPTGSAAPR